MSSTSRRQYGFSIIELLIIIAVIGILSTIIIPTYQSYKMRAHNASVLSYLQYVSKSEENYWLTQQDYISVPAGDGPTAAGVLPNNSVPSGVSYAIGVFPAHGTDAATGYATGGNYIAFAGHINGNKVYATGSADGDKMQWREKKPGLANAAVDAKAEDVSQSTPADWGKPI